MRITFVLPFAELSGGHRVVASYASGLMRLGHSVTIISQPPPSITLRKVFRSLRKHQQFPSRPVVAPFIEAFGNNHIIAAKCGVVTDSDVPDADVVVATWWETAEWVAALSLSKGRKVYLLQGYEMFPYLPLDRVARTYTYDFLKIAVSEYVKCQISKNHGISGIHVIHNAVDSKHFDAPRRPRNARFTVGFMYQIHPVKNVQLALDVVKELQLTGDNLRFISFGAIEPNRDFPLPKYVNYHINPKQIDIPAIYSSCDAWLFTSHSEGFGLPILEAMACRTPVIATKAGAALEIIQNSQNGFISDSDKYSFLHRIQTMRNMSEAEWVTLSTNAHTKARSWTWDDAVKRFEALVSRP